VEGLSRPPTRGGEILPGRRVSPRALLGHNRSLSTRGTGGAGADVPFTAHHRHRDRRERGPARRSRHACGDHRHGDRAYYAAPAISPDGKDVYLTYNAFTTPWRFNTTDTRGLVGVVLHADVSGGTVGSFSLAHRGAVGDPRASSQNNLQAEFLGDYVYTAATNDYGVGVWNDTRNGADCPAIDAWRMSLRTSGDPLPAGASRDQEGDEDRGSDAPADPATPAPQVACPATWGNSDIFASSIADPTPDTAAAPVTATGPAAAPAGDGSTGHDHGHGHGKGHGKH
jgi:hypothetical protein